MSSMPSKSKLSSTNRTNRSNLACVSTRACSVSVSPAGMCSPRCRSGMAHSPSRGSPPRNRMLLLFRSTAIRCTASRIHVTCAPSLPHPATKLATTPSTLTSGSNAAWPSTVAATLRAHLPASTTSRTGASRILAIWAVLPSSDRPSRASCRPMTPSMMQTSTFGGSSGSSSSSTSPYRCRRKVDRTASGSPCIHPSRFAVREASCLFFVVLAVVVIVVASPAAPAAPASAPVRCRHIRRPASRAARCCIPSKKSGPALQHRTARPRAAQAARRPHVTVVLPAPDAGAPTTITEV